MFCSASKVARAFISAMICRRASVASQSRRQWLMHATTAGRASRAVAAASVRSCHLWICQPSSHALQPRASAC